MEEREEFVFSRIFLCVLLSLQVFDPLEEGEYYIKLVLLMTSRNVNVMQFIPALSLTKVMHLVGGYLGLWLGLSLVAIINNTLFFVCYRPYLLPDIY